MIMIQRNTFEIIWHRKSNNFIFAKIRSRQNNEEFAIAFMYIQPCDPDRRLEECMNIFL
jgi:hypothetical protein